MIALLLALFQAAPASQAADETQPPPTAVSMPALSPTSELEAPLAWQQDLPALGALVKLRVRDAALRSLQSAGRNWWLDLAGKPMPAAVVWPQAPAVAKDFPLDFTSKLSKGLTTAIVDRGNAPQRFDELLLEFANQELLAEVKVALSQDGKAYPAASHPQLVYQRLTETGILRLNNIQCYPGDFRYLRIEITGAENVQLVSVLGRQTGQSTNELYKLTAGFGAPLSDPLSHQRLLPLELSSNDLQLARVKLGGAVPPQPILVRIVRLDPAGRILRTVGEGVWGGRLELHGTVREATNLACYDNQGGDEPWALAISQAGASNLEFTELEAWAVETYVTCAMPAPDEVCLRLNKPPPAVKTPASLAQADLRRLPMAGEFSLVRAPEIAPGLLGHAQHLAAQVAANTRRWWLVALYVSTGILCLLVGLNKLRRCEFIEQR